MEVHLPVEETQVLKGLRSDEHLSGKPEGKNSPSGLKKTTGMAQDGTFIEQEETEGLKSTKDMSVVSRLRGWEEREGVGPMMGDVKCWIY